MNDEMGLKPEMARGSILDLVVILAESWKVILAFAIVVAAVTFAGVNLQPSRFDAKTVVYVEPRAVGQVVFPIVESSVRQHTELQQPAVTAVSTSNDASITISAKADSEEGARNLVEGVIQYINVDDPEITAYFRNIAERIGRNNNDLAELSILADSLQAAIARVADAPIDANREPNVEELSRSFVVLSKRIGELNNENASLQSQAEPLSLSAPSIVVTKRSTDAVRTTIVGFLAGAFFGALLAFLWSEFSRSVANPEGRAKLDRIKSAFGLRRRVSQSE